jgi:hypothetical protein
LQSAADKNSHGILSLILGESSVGLQITCGGVTALRTLEGAVENEGGRLTLRTDLVARETRITLGQLAAELREAVKLIRIFGPPELAHQLADAMETRFAAAGLTVEVVSAYAPDEFGVTLPPTASISAAFSLAARVLVEEKPAFEFLPPKPGFIERLVAKHSSGRLRTAGAVGAALALLFVAVFGWQEFRLWHLRSQWSQIEGKVGELQAVQDEIRQYRSWYAGTFKNLDILRQLSLAFPEDGTVTAKNIEIHDGYKVTCSGTAQDYAALLAVQEKLRTADGVSDIKLEQIRGKAPMQFVFAFNYGSGGENEN